MHMFVCRCLALMFEMSAGGFESSFDSSTFLAFDLMELLTLSTTESMHWSRGFALVASLRSHPHNPAFVKGC